MSLARIGVAAERDSDGVALVDDSVTLGWAEVARQVAAVAGQMLAAAPGSGDRVAVVGENAAPTLVAHAAGILAGVGTVAVSRQLTAAEMAGQLTDAGVVAVVTGPLALAAAAEAAAHNGVPTVVVHGGGPIPRGALRWDDWSGGPQGATVEPAGRPARPPLVYTSGTTGRARGTEVRWTPGPPGSAADYAATLAARSGFPAGPHLVVGPLQHNGPLTAVRHLLSGQPVVVVGRFDAEGVLARIQRHRVTSSVMVPTHFQRLLALPPDVRARYDVSSVELLAHTGAACPEHVKRAMIAWFGPVLVESYGGSEVGTVCRITSAEWLAHPGSVGRAVPPFEAVVVDGQHREQPSGTVGQLGFRAPEGRGISYHADPEKTRSAYLLPGVVTLGDVGYVDPDGFVYITDRIADMVVSGGVNLYPAESEKVLVEHPSVAEVAVVGVPDADLGEALRALVVPAGAAPDPRELDAFCRASIAAYKCPKSYEFVPTLARNAMGKLDKRVLRRPYWDGDRTIAG